MMLGRCYKSKGKSDPSSQERIVAILDALESSIGSDPECQLVGQCFHQFRQTILAGNLDI
jgi:hypothetical protein